MQHRSILLASPLTFHLIYVTVKIKINIKNLHYKNNLVKELHFPTIKKSDDD